ncbi:MAG: branched-chain amino acid aminotransferase [Candidatus Marinimicrobia bacterium]|nr:branched-chain amino acid aminotransferase [Candidatus Neomarinimicrobiota bacterium]
MNPKTTEWSKLDFSYRYVPYRFHAYWKDGAWNSGKLVTENKLLIDEGAVCLHYGQEIFEGMKAQRSEDGRIWLFRPEENARRFQDSARRMLMPEIPEELFIRGIKETILANKEYVPPYGTGASLYIRPFMLGVGENLGVRPAPEFIFIVFVTPVGPYFKEGFKPISLKVETYYDRAAAHGVGAAKTGGNYAASLLPLKQAREEGFNDVVYLDSVEHKYFEESGVANIFFVLKNGTIATPKSDAILNSITRRSLVRIARDDFGFTVEERQISVAEIKDFVEAGACGTAAVVTPIGSLGYKGEIHKFYADGKEPGPITRKLYEHLTALQIGDVEDTRGWLKEVV